MARPYFVNSDTLFLLSVFTEQDQVSVFTLIALILFLLAKSLKTFKCLAYDNSGKCEATAELASVLVLPFSFSRKCFGPVR